MPEAKKQQAAGDSSLGTAESYYRNLLTAGRTDTAARAAPAIQSTMAGADAQRRQLASEGTGRSGGTAAASAEAGTSTSSTIDNIINQTLQTGKEKGAAGLEGIGATQLSSALGTLGLSESAVSDIMRNATQSRVISNDIASQTGSAIGQLLIGLATA